jgi:hypothetical protein
MTAVLSLLPLILALLVYALVVRTTARLVKKVALSWKHAFLFTAFTGIGSFVGALALSLAGGASQPIVRIICGFILNLVIGGWYLGPRARKPDGNCVDITGGVVIAASSWFAAILIFGGLFMASQILLRNSQT